MLHKKYPHKRDKDIQFIEDCHRYIVKNAEDFISVTTFIHKFFGKFDATKIIDKHYNNWQENKHPEYHNKTKEEIKALWSRNARESSQHGTKIHKLIEDFLNGLILESDEKEFQYFLDFLKDHPNLEPYRTEMIVFHEELKLAGTIDLIMKDGDDYYIVDHKTNKEIKKNNYFNKGLYPLTHLDDCNYTHYSLQLSIYKAILEKKYGINIKNLYLLWLNKSNDSYKLIECNYLENEVKAIFSDRIKELYK